MTLFGPARRTESRHHACYGWDDLTLQHDFHPNERGQTRFIPSVTARWELVRRMVEVNAKLTEEEKQNG
jgi:hypothetical protein